MNWLKNFVFVLGICLIVSGCGKTVYLESGYGVQTGADERIIYQVKREQDKDGRRRKPEYITCAEPSPDIAKVISESTSISGGFSAANLSGVSPEVAAAISRGKAEGLAQLTQRLATIQLLRDGLYRACEAYANGAISEVTYSVLLSRFDDTMITMLMGEFAANNYGKHDPVVITANADSSVSSPQSAKKKLVGIQGVKNTALKTVRDVDAETANILSNANLTDGETLVLLNRVLKTKDDALETLEEGVDDATKIGDGLADQIQNIGNPATQEGTGSSASQSHSQSATGKTNAAPDTEAQETFRELHRRYLHNINSDALTVACLTALDSELVRKKEKDAGGNNDDDDVGFLRKLFGQGGKDELAHKPDNPSTLLTSYCLTDIIPSIEENSTKILIAKFHESACGDLPEEVDFATTASSSYRVQRKTKAIQHWLNQCFDKKLKVDGVAGRNTSSAFKEVTGRYLVGDPQGTQ